MKSLFDLFERRTFVTIGVLGLLIVGLEYLSIGLILPFMKLATSPGLLTSSRFFGWLHALAGRPSHHRFVLVAAAVFGLLFLGKTALSFLLHRRIAFLTMSAFAQLSERLLMGALRADYRVFIERSPSEFVSTIQGHTVSAIICLQTLAAVCIETVLLCALLVLALWLYPQLTLILVCALLLLGIALRRLVLDKMQQFGECRTGAHVRWHHLTHALISAVRDIKIMGLEDQLGEEFSGIVQEYTTSHAQYLSLQATPKLIGELCFVLAAIAFVCVVQVFQVDLRGNLPTLATFSVILMRIVPCVHKVYNSLSAYRYSAHAMAILKETSALLRQRELKVAHVDVPFNEQIRIENITFRYTGSETPALDHVTVTIDQNSFVGVVGRSGSGKSTFLDVLGGLLAPAEGRILLDGTEVDPFASDALRRFMGYVPQQVMLLDETIGYNIALDKAYRAHMEKVTTAARAAKIAEFIENLPGRYDAPAGEAGVKMSGGQRQRIGIARALYKNPEILLFDEATSAVDALTEQEIMQSVTELAGEKTIVFATHRLQTVERCDRIIVFDAGRVVDTGTHGQLLARCPVYRDMASSASASREKPWRSATYRSEV